MKKQRHAPPGRKQGPKGGVQPGRPGGIARMLGSQTERRFDPPELLTMLVEHGRWEAKAGRPGGLHRFSHDVLTARRVVFTKEFAAAADDLRSEDLGVTVMSLAGACVAPGLTWWEWDARLPNSIPAEPGQLDTERVGALVRADPSGRRGTMNFAVSGADVGGSPDRRAEILPFAINFDWRDDFEVPQSLLKQASPDDVRRHYAAEPYPTLAQAEASPVFMATLTHRFGVVESPYVAKAYAFAMGASGTQPWYRSTPHLLQNCAMEAMQEANLLLAALLLAATGCFTTTAVPQGARLPKPWPWATRAAVNYNVVHFTPLLPPQSAALPAARLSGREG